MPVRAEEARDVSFPGSSGDACLLSQRHPTNASTAQLTARVDLHPIH
jgi:hypothetical protein